jgi:hypothetical protein
MKTLSMPMMPVRIAVEIVAGLVVDLVEVVEVDVVASTQISKGLQALAMSVSQPIYNDRGNIVFGICVDIHKYDTTRELVEAEEIERGSESLSNPP